MDAPPDSHACSQHPGQTSCLGLSRGGLHIGLMLGLSRTPKAANPAVALHGHLPVPVPFISCSNPEDLPVVRRMLLTERPHQAAVVVDENDIRLLSVIHPPLALHQRVVHVPGRCRHRQEEISLMLQGP